MPIISPKLHLAITGVLLVLFIGTLVWSFNTKGDLAESQADLKISQTNVHSLQQAMDKITAKYVADRLVLTKQNDSLKSLNIQLTARIKDFEKQYNQIKLKYENLNVRILGDTSTVVQLRYTKELLSEHDRLYKEFRNTRSQSGSLTR